MKTAEEWIERWDKRNVKPENIETHLTILRAIQLDALQEAARVGYEAATDGLNPYSCSTGTESRFAASRKFKEAILSLANTLTNGGTK